MLCVECAHPVASLYSYYSKDNIQATTCSNCQQFADKYIEYDGVLVFIDLALLKPQAMRHVIFNVLAPQDPKSLWVESRTQKLIIVMLLFDVYMQCAWSLKGNDPTASLFLASTPSLVQYLAFLISSTLDTLTVHIVIRYLASKWLGWHQLGTLSTAIMLSATGKLLPITMLIWDYDMPLVNSVVWWAFAIIMVEAIQVVLSCGYVRATVIASAALAARWVVCNMFWSACIPWLIYLYS